MHTHIVGDSDKRFIVDAVTRQIKNTSSSKTTVMQFDHNSEVFTFEVPKYIEGHDMTECNRVEVHHLNIDAVTKQENEGIYLVEDLAVDADDENKLTCSWLISQNATRFVGSLNFILRFMCLTDDVVDYVWNTSIFSGIYVSKGIYNSNIVAEQYIDTIKAWENRLKVVENSIGSSGISPIINITPIANGNRVEIVDAEGTKTFNVLNGTNGTNGTNGVDGVSPTITVTEIIGGHEVSITDITGTQSFNVMDGQDGQNGADGSGVTEDRVLELINTQLGVVENGTY